MPDALAPEVAVQIEALPLTGRGHLLICDADEVLVRFGVGMEAFLDEQGLYYDWTAFHFEGTIRRQSDDVPVPNYEVAEIRERFLAERIVDLPAVEGASDVLKRLSSYTEIVILTNIPHEARKARIAGLRKLGMDYPVVTNVGGKGHAVRDLALRVDGSTAFVDDLPEHHESVALHAKSVQRIQFIEDPRLEKLVGPAMHSHIRTTTWSENERHLRALFGIGA